MAQLQLHRVWRCPILTYGAMACGAGFAAGFGYLMAQELVWFLTGLAGICHG